MKNITLLFESKIYHICKQSRKKSDLIVHQLMYCPQPCETAHRIQAIYASNIAYIAYQVWRAFTSNIVYIACRVLLDFASNLARIVQRYVLVKFNIPLCKHLYKRNFKQIKPIDYYSSLMQYPLDENSYYWCWWNGKRNSMAY